MVIHHPNCLHVSIANRWTSEFKSSIFKCLTHHLGFQSLSRGTGDGQHAL